MVSAPVPSAVRRLHVPASSVLAVFLVLHGIAHFAGVAGNAGFVADGESAELLGGAWVVGSAAVLYPLAALWAVLGAAHVATGVLVALHRPEARRALVAAAAASTALSVVHLWAAVVGVVLGVALVAAALVVPERVGLTDR